MSHTGADRCDVCGETKPGGVAASTFGPISWFYCWDCLRLGAEPYGGAVAYLCPLVGYSPQDSWRVGLGQWALDVLDATLARAGKSGDEFWADCVAGVKDYNEFFDKSEEE